MRRALAAAALFIAFAGCKDKAKPRAPAAATAVAFDRRLVERDDCVHHAAALAPLDDATLVVGACGRTGEGERGEEILAVRVDGRGEPAPVEPVHVLERGWATSVVAARVRGGGALVGYTVAESRRARVEVVPVDVQGRPAGSPVELGEGRAAALAGGPQGAALALLGEPASLSDLDPAGAATLVVLVLDADGRAVARAPVSERVDGDRAQVALAGAAAGYGVVWSEGGRLWGAALDSDGRPTARAPIAPGPGAGPRLGWPALLLGEGGRALVAAIAEPLGGGPAEIWLGEGKLGEQEPGWKWRRVVAGTGSADAAPRRARLAMTGGADVGQVHLAWHEERPGREFPALVAASVVPGGGEASAATVILGDTVLFDGAVAITSLGRAFVVAGALPPAGDSDATAIGVVQRVE